MIKLKSILIFLCAFAIAFAFAQEKESVVDSITQFDMFSKAMNDSVQKDSTLVFIFVASVILVILIIILFEIYRSKKSQENLLKFAWEKFETEMKSRKLSANNITLLVNIAKKSATGDPSSLLRSPTFFENCLDAMYVKEGLSSFSDSKLESIRELRRTLEYLPLSKEIPIVSTRQMEKGEKCPVQIPDVGIATHKGMAIFLNVNEKYLSITRPDGPKIPKGTTIRLQFSRSGDAEYDFRAQVLEDKKDELIISHANKLSRSQLRNWVRVDVNIPVDIILVTPDGHHGDFLQGTIIDMSGGGLGIVLPTKLRIGQNLLLEFDLPEQGRLSNLLVKIVRVAGAFRNDATKTIHSVAFDGEVRTLQEQIIQYVFEVQRREAQFRRN